MRKLKLVMVGNGMAGVRTLEREIARAARKIVTRIAEGKTGKVVVKEKLIRDLLGKPRYGYREEIEERTDMPGVATGLAWPRSLAGAGAR